MLMSTILALVQSRHIDNFGCSAACQCCTVQHSFPTMRQTLVQHSTASSLKLLFPHTQAEGSCNPGVQFSGVVSLPALLPGVKAPWHNLDRLRFRISRHIHVMICRRANFIGPCAGTCSKWVGVRPFSLT